LSEAAAAGRSEGFKDSSKAAPCFSSFAAFARITSILGQDAHAEYRNLLTTSRTSGSAARWSFNFQMRIV